MSNQISEDVPAPSSSAPSAGAGGSQEKLEKQARQLAYDVKYKVKQQMNRGTKMDPAAVKKAYLSFLGKSTGTPAVKALAKKKLIGEELVQEELDKKYKVRVTDKQTGNTYVRMATRAKISELRANTNIASVEMTGYGEPTKSEKTKGSQTAAAKSGKDYDGDGKRESSSKEHAGVVHNAIQKKKGGKQDGQDTRKEEFIADANNNKEDIDKQIKELKGKKNKVKIMPTMGEDAKHGYDKDGNSLNPDDIKKKNEKDPNGEAKKEEEEDPRSMGTKYRNMKNKLRAMGLNMGFDISGKKLHEEVPVDAKQEKNDKEIESKQKKADVIKRQVLIKKLQAVRAGGGASVTASYKPEGELTEEFITERVDHATEYFFNEGINEEGLDLIIEEVGVDEFTAFVIDGPQELNEDEADYQKAKKKAFAGDARRKREGKGEHSPKGSKSPYAKEGLGAKTKKKPKIGHTGTKVVAATKKAKKEQPAKSASKEGLGSKIRGFVKKGVERHKKAREAGRVPEKRAKEFASGVKSGVKTAVKFAKDVKKVVSKEELEIQENRMAAYTAGAGEGSPASRPTVSKKTADRVSRSSDERAFGNRKKKEGIRLSPTKKYSGKDKGKVVKRANTTGRGTPTQYRKSHEDPDMGRYQQKVTQGSGSIKDIKSSFSNWRNELLGEEGYDRMRDDRLVKYGIGHDGSDRKGPSPRPTGKQPKGKTVYQKQAEKEHGKGVTALDIVKKNIEKKHGKGAIMDTKKK